MSTNLDVVPVLAGEGVDGLLLEALLALRESLVPLEMISCCLTSGGLRIPTFQPP